MRRIRPRHTIALLIGWMACTGSAGAQTQPKPKSVDRKKLLSHAVPGYTLKKIEGFDVLVNDQVLKHNDDAEFKRKPMDVLELELGTVVRVLPKKVEQALTSIVIWAEWDDETDPDYGKVVAKYYGVSGGLQMWSLSNNKNPGKANNIEIVSVKSLTEEHQPEVKAERCVLLHEFAHAIHYQAIGTRNDAVRAAYTAAMDRGLYNESKTASGKVVSKPYASTNDHEYFAELTCCYTDKLYYFPFTRDDLKKLDSNGYKLMEAVWGKADKLEAQIKAENAKAADARVQKAKNLLAEKKKDDAKKLLERVVDLFPKTAGAAEAKKMLEKITTLADQGK
jgi:hypothetical protein